MNYIYNEKHAAKIATETLKNAYNIRSRNAHTILKCSIDTVLWDIANGQDQTRQEIYDTLMSDIRFSSYYFDGYDANVAGTATEKVIKLITE